MKNCHGFGRDLALLVVCLYSLVISLGEKSHVGGFSHHLELPFHFTGMDNRQFTHTTLQEESEGFFFLKPGSDDNREVYHFDEGEETVMLHVECKLKSNSNCKV